MPTEQESDKAGNDEPPSEEVRLKIAAAATRPQRRQAKTGDEGGGTLRPVYGERRPVMYHLLESEMTSISSFNGEAVRNFTLSSFAFSGALAIFLGYLYADEKVRESTKYIALTGGIFAIGFGALFLVFGFWSLASKSEVIRQIKKETISKGVVES